MSVGKIGKIEAVALILIVVINEIVLNIPNNNYTSNWFRLYLLI